MSYDNREPEPCPAGECRHVYDDWPAGSVTRRDREIDQCSVCGWTSVECEGRTATGRQGYAALRHFSVGDRVRHYGTKQWGTVIEVRPTHYGVELVVERIVDHPSDMTGRGYWEGARIDLHERDGKRVVR